MKIRRGLMSMLVSGIAASQANAQCPVDFSGFERVGERVLRDPIPGENYEVASDPHVFFTRGGDLRMIYSGDDGGSISIKLATGKNWTDWERHSVLLGDQFSGPGLKEKETPYYRQAANGEHQIYFIGYDDVETYNSQIYLAVSDRLVGPYKLLPNPVIPRGRMAGLDVALITSPSVVEKDGTLYMVFIGWDDYKNVSEVWTIGATSTDEGRTWSVVGEVPVPVAMEGQVTPMPGGGYVATRTGGAGFWAGEGLFFACSQEPFGPYTPYDDPILTQETSLEKDEIIAPQVTYDPVTKEPVLYYTGADHAKGWWVLMARQRR